MLGHVSIVWKSSIVYGDQPEKITPPFSLSHNRETSCRHQAGFFRELLSLSVAGLEKTEDICDVCQHDSDGPYGNRVSLPQENFTPKRVVSMDLMKLDFQMVLQVVDQNANFVATCFLSGKSSFNIWDEFLSVGVSSYIGYSECIAVDQGSQVQSDEWKNLVQAPGIKLHPSSVESHNAAVVEERYHEFSRRIYSEVKRWKRTISSNQEPNLAGKAINDMVQTDSFRSM